MARLRQKCLWNICLFTIKKSSSLCVFCLSDKNKSTLSPWGETQKNSRDLDQIPTTLKLFHCAWNPISLDAKWRFFPHETYQSVINFSPIVSTCDEVLCAVWLVMDRPSLSVAILLCCKDQVLSASATGKEQSWEAANEEKRALNKLTRLRLGTIDVMLYPWLPSIMPYACLDQCNWNYLLFSFFLCHVVVFWPQY